MRRAGAEFARQIAGRAPAGRRIPEFEESRISVAGAIFKDRMRVAGLIAARRAAGVGHMLAAPWRRPRRTAAPARPNVC